MEIPLSSSELSSNSCHRLIGKTRWESTEYQFCKIKKTGNRSSSCKIDNIYWVENRLHTILQFPQYFFQRSWISSSWDRHFRQPFPRLVVSCSPSIVLFRIQLNSDYVCCFSLLALPIWQANSAWIVYYWPRKCLQRWLTKGCSYPENIPF